MRRTAIQGLALLLTLVVAARADVERDLIAESAHCREDLKVLKSVCKLTPDLETNNWAVLDCLQNPPQEIPLSSECDHYLWNFKLTITKKDRFIEQAKTVCHEDITELTQCVEETDRPGHFLGCLVENKPKVKSLTCGQFLTRLETVIFSDYRLIANFMHACEPSVKKFQCGRVTGVNENDPHSQGKTIDCLSTVIDQVDEKCRAEILTIAELQAEDVHMDRAFFLSCKDDMKKFCEGVPSGEGRVYSCLMRHKMEPGMSEQCRKQISRRQSLASQDYKVSGSLTKACKEEIKTHSCRRKVSKNMGEGGDQHIVKMSQILICLVDASLEGSVLSGKCKFEIDEFRRALMEDYSITPEIVKDCHPEISNYCKDKGKNGQTIHCLMQLQMDPSNQGKISSSCQNTLNTLVREVNMDGDWNADPALVNACEMVVSGVCNVKGGNDAIMNCLMTEMEKDSKFMTTECRQVLMQIQYYLSREVSIDKKLYRECRSDAERMCSAVDGWHMTKSERKIEYGKHLVFPCLVRNLYNEDDEEESGDDDPDADKDFGQKETLSPGCVDEVERVLRERAVSVHLNPEVEEVCRDFLNMHCVSFVHPGQELQCLQDNFRVLDSGCRKAVSGYTELESRNPYLNPLVIKACSHVIESNCGAEDQARNGQGVMDCLVRHSIEFGPNSADSMSHKCRQVVEHWQILTLENWRFSFEFKDSCKNDIRTFCVICRPGEECQRPKDKIGVLECLSKVFLNDTVYDRDQRLSEQCRRQLKFELLQKHSRISLDPKLKLACKADLDKFCLNEDKEDQLECLKDQKPKTLTHSCRKMLFAEEEEEAVDNTVDFALMRACKKEIKEHCMNLDQPSAGTIAQCLEGVAADLNFEPRCLGVLKRRIGQRLRDYRLNPGLQKSCRLDITKYCSAVLTKGDGSDGFYEGKVIECLKEKFSKNNNLLTKPCRKQIKGVVRETAENPNADPLTETLCPITKQQCKAEAQERLQRTNNQDAQMLEQEQQECMWTRFQEGKISDGEECSVHLAITIELVSRDIHADPTLNKACYKDLLKFCHDVPAGEGRRLGCLVVVSKEKSFRLEPQCQGLLNARLTMFDQAVKVNPVEGAMELYQSVMESKHRNFFLTALMVIILVIFGFGLCFGRITKRIRADAKNR